MALDDLKETIESLRECIQTHRAYLAGDETRTRQALIDPMLGALGWDVRNPAQVHLEYRGTSGKPDYALFSQGKVVALIEAKKLKVPNSRIKVGQVIKYARDKVLTSLKYVVWTNGDHWQIWSIEEDREESFQLSNPQEDERTLKAMQLLRSVLEVQDRYPTPKPSRVQEIIDPSNNDDWVTLTSLENKKRSEPSAEKEPAAKKKAKRKPSPVFMRPLQPDDALAAIVGNKPLSRTQITKKIWEYIKRNGLQDQQNNRMINADDKLRAILGGAKKVSMFDLTKHVSEHVE